MSLQRPFLTWPGWRQLGYFAILGAGLTLWFALVYGGADWVTSLHNYRLRVHFDWERAIPFVPATVVGYMALYPLYWLAPFVLRSERELRAMAGTLWAVISVAGVCFLLVPVEEAFPPIPDCGVWDGSVRFAKRLALTNNFLPSLHVAQSVVCAGIYHCYAGRSIRVVLWLWAGAIAASTMLLHQHYVADVVTGWLLGAAAVRWVYMRMACG